MGFFDAINPFASASGLLSKVIDFGIDEYGYNRAEKENEYLANTAMQRRVQDLRVAGLNPMLAFGGQGGAATPPAPSGGNQMQTAALELASAQAAKTRAETGLVNSQHDNIDAQTASLLSSAGQSAAQSDFLKAQLPKVEAEIQSLRATRDLTRLETLWKSFDLEQRKQMAPHVRSLMANEDWLKQLQLPGAKNKAEGQRIWEWFYQNVVPLIPGASLIFP